MEVLLSSALRGDTARVAPAQASACARAGSTPGRVRRLAESSRGFRTRSRCCVDRSMLTFTTEHRKLELGGPRHLDRAGVSRVGMTHHARCRIVPQYSLAD